jgi:hypothetical protein
MMLVPVEGIEPTLLAEHDFESCASTSSATRAQSALYIVGWRLRLSDGLASAFRIGKLLRANCLWNLGGAARTE